VSTKTKTIEKPPREIVRDLLEGGELIAPRGPLTVAEARRLAALERRSPEMVAIARDAGVEIECLGPHPLFGGSRVYSGNETNWIMGPANKPDDAIIPKRELKALRSLTAAGLRFPFVYIAHESDKEEVAAILEASAGSPVSVDEETAVDLVGPVPLPAEAVATSNQLARRTTQVFTGIKRGAALTGAAVATVVASPVVLVGGALAGLASLDPIVLGAIPVTTARDGDMAVWFVLARWDW
jgi:hypothetical protein